MSKTRLFCPAPLRPDCRFTLDAGQTRYLARALRLRAGEKLFEEPLHVSEELRPTEATGILLAAPRIGDDTMLSRLIDEITQAARGKHTDRARGLIHQLVPEYVPTSGGRRGVAVEPAAKLLPDNGNSGTELATVANIAEFSEHANRQRSAKNQAG